MIIWWHIALILFLGGLLFYSIGRFGKQLLAKALIKKEQGLQFGKEYKISQANQQRIETLSTVITRLLRWGLVVVIGAMILSEAGINIVPLVAGAGVIGIALGLGAQSLVKDFLSGIFILLEDQYATGDRIKIDSIIGKVEDISLRHTTLRDLHGVKHFIPNSAITVVSNYTKQWANIILDIGVGYSENLDTVTKVLNTIAVELTEDQNWKSYIYSQPVVLGIENFTDKAMTIRLSGKVTAGQQWAVARELRKRIKEKFDQEHLSLVGIPS